MRDRLYSNIWSTPEKSRILDRYFRRFKRYPKGYRTIDTAVGIVLAFDLPEWHRQQRIRRVRELNRTAVAP